MHCQQWQSIFTRNRDIHSHFQGLEISFPKIAQVVKFHQKNLAPQLQMSAQGLRLKHKGLRELKKLWRTNERPLCLQLSAATDWHNPSMRTIYSVWFHFLHIVFTSLKEICCSWWFALSKKNNYTYYLHIPFPLVGDSTCNLKPKLDAN